MQFPRNPTCADCPLHSTATTVCIPTIHLGLAPTPTTPALAFIGQNPGYFEDKAGQPFVGKSGKLLRTLILKHYGFDDRASIYLTNVARCGPSPDVTAAQYNTCFPLYTLPDITRIIDTHSRCAVICLGAFAVRFTWQHLLSTKGMTLKKSFANNGRTFNMGSGGGATTLFSTYHPAAILRNGSLIHPCEDHMDLISRWLDRRIPIPSHPTIVPTRSPC